MRNFSKIFLLILSLSSVARAANITKSYTFSSGQVASAASVNANFDQLYTEMNSKETRLTTLEGSGAVSPFLINGTAAYYNAGNVGLGTNAPTALLHIKNNDGVTRSPTLLSFENVIGNAVIGFPYTSSITNGFDHFIVDSRGSILKMDGGAAGAGHTLHFSGPTVSLATGADENVLIKSMANSGRTFTIQSPGDLIFNTFIAGFVPIVTFKQSGNVGIGTSAPTSSVHVVRTGSNAVLALENTDGSYPGVALSNAAGLYTMQLDGVGASLYFYNGTDRVLNLTHAGNVGINTANPAAMLDVNGTIRGIGITDLSDERLKQDVQPLTDDLRKILLLRGVSFRWKDPKHDDGQQLGMIAQDVEKVYPDLVETDKTGLKSIQYSHLVAPLIEAFKSLHGLFGGHESRLQQLEAENAELRARLVRLEEAMRPKN